MILPTEMDGVPALVFGRASNREKHSNIHFLLSKVVPIGYHSPFRFFKSNVSVWRDVIDPKESRPPFRI